MPSRAQIFGSGPSLGRWLDRHGSSPIGGESDALRCALNEACRFVDCAFTFAADPVDRFAAEIPHDTVLVTTQEAIDNARAPAPGCQRIVAPVDRYRGSVILAVKWLAANRGITEFELIGIDGGSERAPLPWLSPPSLCRRSYNVIRAELVEYAHRRGITLTFWSTAEVIEPSLAR